MSLIYIYFHPNLRPGTQQRLTWKLSLGSWDFLIFLMSSIEEVPVRLRLPGLSGASPVVPEPLDVPRGATRKECEGAVGPRTVERVELAFLLEAHHQGTAQARVELDPVHRELAKLVACKLRKCYIKGYGKYIL